MARLYSDEQIAVANNVDLADFLKMQGESLIKSGKDMRWARQKSVTVRGNRWYEWKSQEGGYPIEFLKRFYQYDFKKAMEVLLSVSGEIGQEVIVEKDEPKEFVLPPRNATMKRAYGYLNKTRYIDREVIDEFVKRDLIYEDAMYHNVVFVGYDEEGVPRHAHKKSTFSNASKSGKSFRGNVEGSDPRYTFHYIGHSNKLFVFEAPIDMLSYISLNKHNWKEHSYIALNGLGAKGLEHMIESYPHLKLFLLCFDHDIAGIEGTERVSDMLFEKGIYEVGIVQSRNKDFNEDLKQIHGIETIKAEENPKYDVVSHIVNEIRNNCNDNDYTYSSIVTLNNTYANLCYAYRKQGEKDFQNIYNNLEEVLCQAVSSLHHQLFGTLYFNKNSQVWHILKEEYRSYKDKSSLEKNMNNLYESLKELKTAYDNQSNQAVMEKGYRKVAENTLYTLLNCRRELERIMELNNKFGLPKDKRPEAKLIGEDGNIFNLMGIASRSLKSAGYDEEAKEMFDRITNGTESYEEALAIILQYVEPVGEDIEYEEDYDVQMRGYE